MSRERERFDGIGKKIKRDYTISTSDASSSQMGITPRRYVVGPTGTLNTITPCAACKLLRRRCAKECLFSPYFSPHEPQKFASVHKVFGASNVSKLLMEVPESQRTDAANSLVYEANARLRDPVFGCMGAISALQQEVHSLQAELDVVRTEIMKYKYRESNIIPSNISHLALFAPPPPPPLQSPPLPPPPHTPYLPSSSSSCSLYTPPSTATDYSTISNENVPYFG